MSVSLANKVAVSSKIANQSFFENLNRIKAEFPFDNKVTLIHCPTFNFDSFNVEVAKKQGLLRLPSNWTAMSKGRSFGFGCFRSTSLI